MNMWCWHQVFFNTHNSFSLWTIKIKKKIHVAESQIYQPTKRACTCTVWHIVTCHMGKKNTSVSHSPGDHLLDGNQTKGIEGENKEEAVQTQWWKWERGKQIEPPTREGKQKMDGGMPGRRLILTVCLQPSAEPMRRTMSQGLRPPNISNRQKGFSQSELINLEVLHKLLRHAHMHAS